MKNNFQYKFKKGDWVVPTDKMPKFLLKEWPRINSRYLPAKVYTTLTKVGRYRYAVTLLNQSVSSSDIQKISKWDRFMFYLSI